MAQKESSHRETVDELNDELSTIRKQHDELTALSRDQVSRIPIFSRTTSDFFLDP